MKTTLIELSFLFMQSSSIRNFKDFVQLYKLNKILLEKGNWFEIHIQRNLLDGILYELSSFI